mmetsp:Transcript_22077/g.33360  ORF Transcript_22077/g.33360 Transcript_22077/m.33360 type:complete len:235 (+) Transcript_22077:20-724(+)
MMISVVLLLLIPSVQASDVTCTASWMSLSAGCSTSGFNRTELLDDACPKECQALLDAVISDCSEGDSFDDSSLLTWPAEPNAFLYHRMYQTIINPKWKSCNYDYAASTCDIAYGIADMTRFPESMGPQLVENPTACFKDNNEACSPACKAIIDDVKAKCTAGATYSPKEGPGANLVRTWQIPQSMTNMKFNPSGNLGSWSASCWEYYTTTSASAQTMIGASLSLVIVTVALWQL